MIFANLLETFEEVRRRVEVSAFTLDRLDNESCNVSSFVRLHSDLHLNVSETGAILLFIVVRVLFQRVLVAWEICDWPIEGGDVYLMDSFGAGNGD